MSAGGLSYNCLTTYGKATLPSVEMWGTNMNILKDPNKGIYTRKIDKVGDTQSVLLSQENSGDRIAECINVYARGVNPMVSVSYDNYGNNAGMRTNMSQRNNGVKLPYKPEVFYPPTFRQEDLMPLSRQPREWFYALSNPSMPNILSQMNCPDGKSAIQNNGLKTETISNIEYNLKDTPRVSNIDKNANINFNEKNPQRYYETNALTDNVMGDFSNKGKDPRYFNEIRQYNRDTNIQLSSVGDGKDIMVKTDRNAVHKNKLLYNALSNISGNKSINDIRDTITHMQNKAVTDLKNKMDSIITNVNDYEMNQKFEYYNDIKGIDTKNINIPYYPKKYNNITKEGENSEMPSSGIQENYTMVDAMTNTNTNITKNSIDIKGFSNISTKNPIHTSSETNLQPISEINPRNEGFEHFRLRAIHDDAKFGSWVVSDSSKPFAGSDILYDTKPKLNPKIHTEYFTKPRLLRYGRMWNPLLILNNRQETMYYIHPLIHKKQI